MDQLSLRDLVTLPEGLTELENNLPLDYQFIFVMNEQPGRATGFPRSLSPLSSPCKAPEPYPWVSMEVLLQEEGPACVTPGNELSEETHVLTKQEPLLRKDTQPESSR